MFQIGFNRCGTRAIGRFLEHHGYRAAHWEFGQLARDLQSDLAAGRRPLAGWAEVDVFTDIEQVDESGLIEGFREFRALHAAYPKALFVLNTRDVEAWLRSRARHAEGAYLQSYRKHRGLPHRHAVLDAWRRDWFAHHLDVIDYFSGPNRENLFVWSLERPNFKGLSVKLGHELDVAAWHKVGSAESDAQFPSPL
ncbi:sulfotransferase [Pseudoruegeria sp. SHC-113]|uniref:sulfotransferase n=1 Tax=Pseudoruegeria sp. SHC-113 TaxID=2855439 RepID=UPI0021BAADF7|nr:sulfotransferase [Pseudoruegeria sp. SHC-113]MCT8161207.1 hypothetical protein [Pseudoruegeria sp. SHC-113]